MRPYKSLIALTGALLLALLLVPGGTTAPPDKQPARPDEAPKAPATLTAERAALDVGQAKPATVGAAGAFYRVLHVEFEDAASCANFGVKHKVKGTHVLSRFEKWADLFLEAPSDATEDRIWADVRRAPGYRWAESGSLLFAPPTPPGPEGEKTRDVSSPIVRGGVKEGERTWTGKGVIIAVIDSGLDFRHPDFITYDDKGLPTSRVLYFWDTTWVSYNRPKGATAAPYSYPNGTPLGTLLSQDELTAQLRGGRPLLPTCDLNGHGTACASVAAGNGNGAGPDAKRKREHAGVAPEADIIAIRIGGAPGLGLPNACLLGAICAWLDEVSRKAGKPYVVSCSFGGQYGGRDGYRVLERQLDARFPPDAPGKALCIAAGNDGDYALHAEAVFGGEGDKKTLRWLAPARGNLLLYYDTSDKDDLRFLKGDTVTRVASYTHGLTKTALSYVLFNPGRGELTLFSASGKRVRVDAYISPFKDDKHRPLNYFVGATAVAARQINTPATTSNAITVGSYDFNREFDQFGRGIYLDSVSRNRLGDIRLLPGELSGYSNPGPRRGDDKQVKPEVAGPGQWYVAAAPLNVTVNRRDTTGLYRAFNGTSAATPHVAGLVALILEKNKKLTGTRIKELLRKASRDDKTGEVPNPRWGYGKLDQAAAERILRAVPTP